MTKDEYQNITKEMIYLVRCVVNNTVPDKERILKMNLTNLYQVAQKHMMTVLVAYVLESVGIFNRKFVQARGKAVRKVVVMEIDKDLLFERLEQEGIWYMPVKGIIIKDFYPSVGMRQMADYDILFNETYADKVKEIMEDLGFTCQNFGRADHDIYYKQPVSNFEMHRVLFDETSQKEIYDYYRDIKKRFIKNEGSEYGYHFSNEDWYIYMIAHEYKHYQLSGTGFRSLLDTYIFWQKLGNDLNTDYIATEIKKLNLSDFERKNKELAFHLFGKGELTESDKEMMEYVMFSGTYGSMWNNLKNSVNKYGGGTQGKRRFWLRKIFLPMAEIKVLHPFYYRHKVMLPILPFYRIGRAFTVNRKKTMKKIKLLKKMK